MNRRSFFTSLALIGAAASAPGIFIPKLEPVRWKVITPSRIISNPEYVRAEYECFFVDMPPVYDRAIWETDLKASWIIRNRSIHDPIWNKTHPYNPRYKLVDGYFVPIHPFIGV